MKQYAFILYIFIRTKQNVHIRLIIYLLAILRDNICVQCRYYTVAFFHVISRIEIITHYKLFNILLLCYFHHIPVALVTFVADYPVFSYSHIFSNKLIIYKKFCFVNRSGITYLCYKYYVVLKYLIIQGMKIFSSLYTFEPIQIAGFSSAVNLILW